VPARGDAVGVASAIIDAAGEAIAGARVLIPQAEGGRPEAAAALREAGAAVDVVAAYRSEPIPPDDPAVAYGLRRLREGDIDCVVFFAPSQVRALLELAGAGAVTQVRACSIVATIGATTARALTGAGIPVQVVASRPDVGILAAEIADHHQRPAKEDA
jgi:uroporphyrinogen-III synthase